MKKYTIEQLEKMVDTHEILPNGSVVTKQYAKRLRKKKSKNLNSEAHR